MEDDLRIREAKVADAPSIAQAWLEFGRYYADLDPVQFRVPEAEGLVDWVEGQLKQERTAEDGLRLVAERADRLVGYIKAQIWRPSEDADQQIMREVGETVLKVDAIMVTEDQRRKGVGKALMDAVEEWGRRKGASQAVVISYANSPSSVPFYEHSMSYAAKTIGYWKAL